MRLSLHQLRRQLRLRPTGSAKPDDATIEALNKAIAKTPEGSYIWRTAGDDKVRPSHAELEGTARDWNSSPSPGEDYNCRCWAEPTDAINPVYPELILIPASKIGRIIKIIKEFYDLYKNNKFTNHGNLRSRQRDISQREIQEAIKTAKDKGNVTIKTGKYGTPQNIYKGSNGVTVVEETEGRNAGKVITTWRH